MKKIFDWTVGSFFRTIGRTIAFFTMAMLVYYFLSYNDIDFGIKNLFFENVKAEELEQQQLQFYSVTGSVSNASSITNDIEKNFYTYQGPFTFKMYGNFILRNQTDQYDSVRMFYAKIGFCTDTVNFLRAFKNGNGGTNNSVYDMALSVQNTNQECYFNNNGSYKGHLAYVYVSAILDSSIYDSVNHNIEYVIDQPITITTGSSDISYSVLLVSRVFGENSQIIDNNDVYFNQIIQQQQATTNAINSLSQQQQQQHQETMNSSTTDAENDASSFFGNFTVEDQGGLSAIVTAPLNTIRSLLSSTCADLVLPLPFVDEDLTLPCMYSIYSQHFGAFFSLYQTIILGIIAYRCIMSIFFDIKGFTNPNDDRIEVMDL